MGKYLLTGSYSVEGIKGVLKDGGTARVRAVERLAESVGGRLDTMYFGFGTSDFWIIVDMPDNASVAATSMTVAATGAASVNTVVLLTPAEVDSASKRNVDYRRPGA